VPAGGDGKPLEVGLGERRASGDAAAGQDFVAWQVCWPVPALSASICDHRWPGPSRFNRAPAAGRESLAWREISTPPASRIQECLAESFDKTYNILILLYPIMALTTKTVVMLASANSSPD